MYMHMYIYIFLVHHSTMFGCECTKWQTTWTCNMETPEVGDRTKESKAIKLLSQNISFYDVKATIKVFVISGMDFAERCWAFDSFGLGRWM